MTWTYWIFLLDQHTYAFRCIHRLKSISVYRNNIHWLVVTYWQGIQGGRKWLIFVHTSHNSSIQLTITESHNSSIQLTITESHNSKRKRKEKMFIQIENIWYYNVYIHKLKLSIKYFILNITVTCHAEKVSMFTRQISVTRFSLLW